MSISSREGEIARINQFDPGDEPQSEGELAAAERDVVIKCCVCLSSEAKYGPLGCQHLTLCKRCAMKQATGGKCKSCGGMFFELKYLAA